MMKTLKRLVTATKNTTVNNHAVEHLNYVRTTCYYTGKCKVGTWGQITNREVKHVNGFTRAFSYHDSTICLVDDENHRIILTNAGWNTRSTTRALNDYRRYFVEECGYTEVKDI